VISRRLRRKHLCACFGIWHCFSNAQERGSENPICLSAATYACLDKQSRRHPSSSIGALNRVPSKNSYLSSSLFCPPLHPVSKNIPYCVHHRLNMSLTILQPMKHTSTLVHCDLMWVTFLATAPSGKLDSTFAGKRPSTTLGSHYWAVLSAN
jgi:hypothetical protein